MERREQRGEVCKRGEMDPPVKPEGDGVEK